MEFIYRKAELSDSERISELFIEMLKTIYNTDDVEGYEEGYLDKYFSESEDLIYVAECDKEVIAFLSVEVYKTDGYVYLDDLSVTEKYRNRGIGSKLIKLAEDYSKDIGVSAIVFHVDKTNEKAHQLYRRLGYTDNEDQGNRMRMVKEIKKNLTTKQFQILTDINLVWDFQTDIYDCEQGSGVAAPFFEHAILASWMDNSYSYLNRFWFDGDRVVAFVFYEAPATDIYFSVRKGYEYLADELIDYAMTTMPNWDGEQQLILFNGQEYLMESAKKHGFKMVFEYDDRILDFKNELKYELPEGYHFVESGDIDPVKIGKLCWYGFNHGDKGDFVNWDKQDTSFDWTPEKSYKDCLGNIMAPLPHATQEYNVVIADELGEYVCFSGMWWVPQNNLAYMEPLCTAPEHRRKGLAAAALTFHYRRMKALGATHMTGGGDPFYEKIGYGKGLHWTFWKR